MLSLINRAVIKLLNIASDKPLPPPTGQEMELVDRLRKSFGLLPVIEPKHVSPSEAVWISNTNRLRELVLNNDPRRFLRWDVVQRTMFVTLAGYTRKELRYLKKLPDWSTRWRKAINESTVGNPVPCPLFPSSSSNLIHHAYHLAQFEEKVQTRVNKMKYILEFGGGYGSMCRLFYNLGFTGKYVIFDLPSFSELQRFYLESHVPRPMETNAEGNAGVICISDFEKLKALLMEDLPGSDSMFVATWSISETPVDLRNSILPLVSDFRAFLLAYQHQFMEVNNVEFFLKWKERFGGQIVWHNWQIHQHLGQ